MSAEEPIELAVVAERAGVTVACVRRYLEFGLLESVTVVVVGEARYAPVSAARVARAERLRCDLELNEAGAVLACELLDRIRELERRLSPMSE